MLVVAYTLGWFISSQVDRRAELSAEQHANFVAGVLVAADLDAGDVTTAGRARAERLEEAIDHEALDPAVVGVRVRRFDGTVILSIGSTPHAMVAAGSLLPRAFEGRPISEATVSSDGVDLYATYVPLKLAGDEGLLDAVAEVYQDKRVVTAGFDGLRWSIIPGVVVGLAVLYLLLLKVWRAALGSVEATAVERELVDARS